MIICGRRWAASGVIGLRSYCLPTQASDVFDRRSLAAELNRCSAPGGVARPPPRRAGSTSEKAMATVLCRYSPAGPRLDHPDVGRPGWTL